MRLFIIAGPHDVMKIARYPGNSAAVLKMLQQYYISQINVLIGLLKVYILIHVVQLRVCYTYVLHVQ